MKFCEKLQKLRKEKGYSQEQLADLLEVSRQSVSKWESGTTYPEMDKLLMLCKIFNVTLDDLTNDEVTDTLIKEKNKGTFNNIIYAILEMISKSVSMFKQMNKKELSKCITELIIVVILLMFCAIPFGYVDDLARDIFINFGHKAYSIIFSIWTFFTSIIYLVLFITVLVYFFKTRYLDKFEMKEVKEEDLLSDDKEIVEDHHEKIKGSKKEHSFILFDVLGSIFNVVLKFCLIIFIVPIVVTFFALSFAFIVAIILFLKGITYPGIIIILLGAILIAGLMMEISIRFLVNAKLKFQRLFWVFVSGLMLCSIGSAVATFEFAETEFIYTAPENITKGSYDFNFVMQDDMYIAFNYHYIGRNMRYEVDNTLGNNVNIVANYYDDYISLNAQESDDKEISIMTWESPYVFKNTYRLLLDNLKEKKLYNYTELYTVELIVRASEENISKLKSNRAKALKEKEEREKVELEIYYQNQNQFYVKKIDDLSIENDLLKEKLEDAKVQIEDLENKIREIENLVR